MGKVWLIRHGLTNYNVLSKQSRTDNSEKTFRWDPEFADAVLAPEGIEQLEASIGRAHSLDVALVLVSPLRRALQTCEILFSAHPNRPQVLVQPLLHEVIDTAHDASVFAGEPLSGYSHYDWSQVPVEATHLARHTVDNELTVQLEGIGYAAGQTKLLELIHKAQPGPIEQPHEGFTRAQKARALYESFSVNIAVVSHSNLLRKSLASLNVSGEIVENKYFVNGEIYEYC